MCLFPPNKVVVELRKTHRRGGRPPRYARTQIRLAISLFRRGWGRIVEQIVAKSRCRLRSKLRGIPGRIKSVVGWGYEGGSRQKSEAGRPPPTPLTSQAVHAGTTRRQFFENIYRLATDRATEKRKHQAASVSQGSCLGPRATVASLVPSWSSPLGQQKEWEACHKVETQKRCKSTQIHSILVLDGRDGLGWQCWVVEANLSRFASEAFVQQFPRLYSPHQSAVRIKRVPLSGTPSLQTVLASGS